ncbi:MAG: hypothetical protein KGO93_09660 [Cyanobacteria bacterium REEB446]|nr:hypothetical protein [Cyanobacteria bacterium REEB446]
MQTSPPSFLDSIIRLISPRLTFINSSIVSFMQQNRSSFTNMKSKLDYYIFVIEQYWKFYSIKENQNMLKYFLKQEFRKFISTQKYQLDRKKDDLLDNFHYEKRKLVNRIYDSKYKLLKKVDEVKSNSEKILTKLNS